MLKEEQVLESGIIALKDRLARVPSLKVNGVVERDRRPGRPDGILSVISIQNSFRLMIEAKNNGEPRVARNAVNALMRYAKEPDTYGVFLAPYISPQSAQICQESGVGYLDLSGNCLLSYGQVYILVENRPNKFSKRRDLVTLYSPKTERILRVLLTNPFRPWRTIELSQAAQVSLGMVSNVRQRLAGREWVRDTPQGFLLAEPDKLLAEWAANYSFRRNQVHDCYTLKSVVDFESQLGEFCNQEAIEYAFTGFSASNYFAPGVRNQRSMAFIRGDIGVLSSRLGLKPVDSGANVSLIYPYDQGVLYGIEVLNGVNVVSPIQAYLDLKSSKGRGEEAAENLFKEVIQKRWSMLQTTM